VKAKHHASAAQPLAKRGFAADGKVEQVLPGSNLDATVVISFFVNLRQY
jgi:hypothetical protein